MKRIKYLFMAVVAMAAFAACSDNCDTTDGVDAGLEGYYFPGASTIKLAMDATSAQIPVARMSAGAAETISLAVDAPAIFNVPTSVTFADGAKEASLNVTFDNADVEIGEEYELTIELADLSMGTPYGASVYDVVLTIPAPYTSLGNASFSDPWNFEDDVMTVAVEQNDLDGDTFRLVNPYEAMGSAASSPYLVFRMLKKGSTLAGVTIEDDDLVYFEPTCDGYFHSNYGSYEWLYHPAHFASLTDWSYNRVLSWQSNGLPAVVQLAPYYYMPGIGGWNYSTTNGAVTIVFPGVVVADFSVEVAYSGYMTDPKGNRSAVASVTLGKDILSSSVAMAATDDPEEVLEAIVNETIDYQTLNASGDVMFPLTEDGTYTIVAVTYGRNSDGAIAVQETAYTTFNFFAGNDTRTPIDKDYTLEDLYGFEKEDICKTWNMYAIDIYGDSGEREFFGELEFSEGEPIYNEEYDYDMDIVNVSGLALGYVKDDTTPWEYDEGILYNLGRNEAFGMVNTGSGPMYFGAFVYEANEGGIWFDSNDWIMVAGLVEDGYMAIVSAYDGYNFCGYDFGAFTAAEMGNSTYAGSFGIGYYDIILQDPAVVDGGAETYAATAAVASTTRTQLQSLVKDMKVASGNMVELRGRERMRALISEMRIGKKADKAQSEVVATGKVGVARRGMAAPTTISATAKLR